MNHRTFCEMTISAASSDPGRAGGLGCDEPLTKLKVRVGGPVGRSRRVGGVWQPRHQGQGRAAPIEYRRRRRRAACPPCRAAPTSAGFMPPRARSRHAGRGGRRCRAATRPRATSRGSLPPQAQLEGRQVEAVPAFERATGRSLPRRAPPPPAAAAVQLPIPPAPRATHSWSGCRAAPMCRPRHRAPPSTPARRACPSAS